MTLRFVACALALCLWSTHSGACSPIYDYASPTPREVLADSDLVLHVRLTGLDDAKDDWKVPLKVIVLGVLKGTYSNEPINTTNSGACGALEILIVGSEYVLFFPRRDGDLRVNLRSFQVATSGLLRQLALPWDERIDRTKQERAEINQRELERAQEQGKRDRLLLSRYPNEAAHREAWMKALEKASTDEDRRRISGTFVEERNHLRELWERDPAQLSKRIRVITR